MLNEYKGGHGLKRILLAIALFGVFYSVNFGIAQRPVGSQNPPGAPTSGVNLRPSATQTIVQPAGTTLAVNSLNNVIYLSAGSDIGVQINSAVATFGTGGGTIVLPSGGVPMSSTAIIPYSTISLVGRGANATVIRCTVAGDCLDIYPAYGVSLGAAAELGNFGIQGNGAIGQNLIHTRDLIGYNVHDMLLTGATAAGSACLLIEDYKYFTERNTFKHLNMSYGCAKAVRLYANPSTDSYCNSGTNLCSFGYNDFDFLMNPGAGQYGLSMEGPGQLYYGFLHMRGNAQGTAANPARIIHIQDIFQSKYEYADVSLEENSSGGTVDYLFDQTGTTNIISWYGHVLTDGFLNNYTASGFSPQLPDGGWGADYTQSTYTPESGIPYDFSGGGATYLIPTYAASGYLSGIGLRGRFQYSSGNFLCLGDQVHNGCAFELIDISTGTVRFYNVPNTGGTNQVISPTSLGKYLTGTVTAGGAWSLPSISAASVTATSSFANGAGFQIAIGKVCATTTTPLNTCVASMTLPVAEPNASYSVSGCVAHDVSAAINAGSTKDQTTTGFLLTISGLTSTANSTGTLTCIVTH